MSNAIYQLTKGSRAVCRLGMNYHSPPSPLAVAHTEWSEWLAWPHLLVNCIL